MICLALEYAYSYSSDQVGFNDKFWKPTFWFHTPIFIFPFFLDSMNFRKSSITTQQKNVGPFARGMYARRGGGVSSRQFFERVREPLIRFYIALRSNFSKKVLNNMKNILGQFWLFWILFDIFGPGICIFIFLRSSLLQR